MAVPGPMFTIAGGDVFDLGGPINPGAGQSWQVKIDNISPFPLTISGAFGDTVTPFTSNVFTVTRGTVHLNVRVGFIPPLWTVPPGVPSFMLTTWSVLPDRFSGSYPLSLAFIQLAAVPVEAPATT